MMGVFPWTLRKLRLAPPDPDPIPAKPAEEKLPPWRIEHHDGALHVTDGIICMECSDSVKALSSLANLSRIWPQGTGKPTAGEVQRAKRDGWRSGFLQGAAAGCMFVTALSILIQMLIMALR